MSEEALSTDADLPRERSPRADGARFLCDGQDLKDLTGRRSFRFDLGFAQGPFGPIIREGFALRLRSGEVRAFVNVCAHRGQPVDLGDGKLWDPDGTLECQAHGAHFDAATGICVRGPCEGKSLTRLELFEEAGEVFLGASASAPVDDDFE